MRALFITIILAIFCLAGTANSANLLSNSGFEFGLNYWGTLSGCTISPQIDSGVAHSGSNSAKLVGMGTHDSGGVLQKVTVLPGQSAYGVSGWVKTSGLPSGWHAVLQAEFVDSSGAWLGIAGPSASVGATSDWTFVQGAVVVPTGTATMYFECAMRDDMGSGLSNSGTAWFDDLALTPCTICGAAVLDGYVGDITIVGATVQLIQNGSTVRTDKMLLGSGGTFSLTNVTPGTYNVAIKASHSLTTTQTGVVVGGDTDLGNVHLTMGDLNGDNKINSADHAFVLSNYDQRGVSSTSDAPAPPTGVTMGRFVPLGAGGIFYPGEQPQLLVELRNQQSGIRSLTVQLDVADFYGNAVSTQQQTVSLGSLAELDLIANVTPPSAFGFYTVTATVKQSSTVLASGLSSFCEAAQMASGNQFFGMSAMDPGDPASIRRMGAGSVGFGISWASVEPQKGAFSFSAVDSALQPWLDQGIRPIGFISCWNGIPSWAQQPVDLDEWGQFISAAVAHYKDRIRVWSYNGELDLMSSSDVATYERLIPRAATETRKLDATCVMGGVGVNGENLYAASSIWDSVWPSLDGMFFDPYIWPCSYGPGYTPPGDEQGGFRGMLTEARDVIAGYGKNILAVDEKGMKIVTSLPVDSPYAKTLAKAVSRSFIIAKSVPEVDRYLYFRADSAYNEGGLDYGLWLSGCPRPSVAAYATTARMLMNTSNPTELLPSSNIYIYVFQQGTGLIATAWTIQSTSTTMHVNLPTQVTNTNLMGNQTGILPAGANNIVLTDSPQFFASSGSVQNLVSALGAATFGP